MKSFTSGAASQARAQQAWLQGRAFGQKGAWDRAADRYQEAARLQPRDALYGMNLADALIKAGRPAQAAAAAAAARHADPVNPVATALQAKALLMSMQFEELAGLVDQLPQAHLSPDVLSCVGIAEFKLGRAQAAVQTFLKALMQRPQDATLHYRLGLSFNELKLKQEASECFRTALMLGLGPLEVGVRDLLAFYEREVCDWQGGDSQVVALRESIARLPADAAVQTNPFAHVTLLDDPEAQLRAARACARYMDRQATRLQPRRAQAKGRLRIGYVSSDFHRHATSYLMAQLLEQHDRSRFEIFLYSHGRDDGSQTRSRIRAAADHFIEAQRLSVAEMAGRVRDDGIDILVDLKGYTQDARPALFAARAAPVQVAYLGFPGTSGSDSIDYIIGDPSVTPLEHAAHFSEKIAQLPGCYQCNDGTRPLPLAPSRASQGLPQDALVLCGFNQPYKISPEVFDVWCRILRRVEGSVLWLLDWHPQALPALRREAQSRGVDPSRLVFAPKVDQKEHLDRIACADLFLDTWPCNAHTTASDVLWAGVPLVTLEGRTFASRVAASLLHAVGAPGAVCDSVEAYEAKALELAGDPTARLALRRGIEDARHSSPLFDGHRIARQIESLYGRMWERAVAGLAPDHLVAQG
jgi:predicted O-linked N-acetylglucosamine transferase (SPINDLY family)